MSWEFISNNTSKGIYWEKVDNSSLDNVTLSNNGTSGASASGIDINLKYGTYSNISLRQIQANANGLGDLTNGTGITIKGRNDAPSYNSNPASVSGSDE